jgi:hypothetical protein
VNVNVLALPDRRNDLANILTVFDDRIADIKVAQGNLVSERDRFASYDLTRRFITQGLTLDRLAGSDVCDRDSDIIAAIVNDKISHRSSRTIRCAASRAAHGRTDSLP